MHMTRIIERYGVVMGVDSKDTPASSVPQGVFHFTQVPSAPFLVESLVEFETLKCLP